MARKSLKRELSNKLSETQHYAPVSSGDTILIDSDVTMVDEGYETNHQHKAFTTISPVTAEDERRSNDESRNADDGLQVLGRGVKKLVQAVQALRHLGVEDLDLPLPKIVVVGDQSTGKSSLIEGISEIKVPRSAGTCTRCPMEINIAESPTPWSCKISLYKKYIYDGSQGMGRTLGKTAAKLEGATRSRPLGPWTLQDAEDYAFATVTDKKEVANAIYLAQLATLNPRNNYEKYLPGNSQRKEEQDHQVKFSPNVVRLHISGPNLPNLSFYDLPGVINVSEVAEEAYLVDLVKNLVKEYIGAEDCINLLALPMSDDPANSSASRLIREVKAEARTLGCLTKPDRIQQSESLEQWTQVLNGQRFQLGFGYHVVMNNPDVRVSHSIARIEEKSFFSLEAPWATTLNCYASRFGTLQLQTVLSQRLTAQIRKSLPRITEQVQQKAENIDARLKELPEPLDSNLALSVMVELLQFERQLKESIDGGQKTNSFHKEWNQWALRFRQDLAETRPTLLYQGLQVPVHSQSPNGNQNLFGTPTPVIKNSAAISIDSDESDNPDNMESPSKLSPLPPRVGQKRPVVSAYTTPKKLQRATAEFSASKKPKTVSSKKFSLQEIRNILQDAYIGLHNLIDPKAIEKMIRLSMEHWEHPLSQFLAQTRKLCEVMVFQQIQDVYAKYSETQYYEQIRQICETFFDKAFTEQTQLLMRILEWEQSRPMTCNDEAINLAQSKAFTLLETKRRETRATAYLNEQEARLGKPSSGQARVDKLAKVTDSQLGPDPYKKEIEAMTTVKAYYECAYFRFVDVVCASVHCELFTKCRDDIVKEMRTVFDLSDPLAGERLAKLLAANPAQEQRRAQLKKEKDTIAKAQARLEGLTDDM